MIVLSSGERISPEEIESHYRRSLFIREVCVIGLASPTGIGADRLFAIVVPDLDLLRAKHIVNAGDIIRVGVEGVTAELAAHQRVIGHDIWFEPLPRTPA